MIPMLLLFLIIYVEARSKKALIAKMTLENRKNDRRTEMTELAKLFVGKECLIYAFDCGHQFTGVIKEVSDSAILIEKDGKLEALNLDFVIRIREYPLKKNGKKKSVVLD